jgi:hypothetical protein
MARRDGPDASLPSPRACGLHRAGALGAESCLRAVDSRHETWQPASLRRPRLRMQVRLFARWRVGGTTGPGHGEPGRLVRRACTTRRSQHTRAGAAPHSTRALQESRARQPPLQAVPRMSGVGTRLQHMPQIEPAPNVHPRRRQGWGRGRGTSQPEAGGCASQAPRCAAPRGWRETRRTATWEAFALQPGPALRVLRCARCAAGVAGGGRRVLASPAPPDLPPLSGFLVPHKHV